MYRLKDPRQIPTSKPANPMTTAMAPLKSKDRMPTDTPKASGKPQSRPIPQDEDRRNAVSDASTAEPLENRFESFPAFESYYQAERRMSLHPDNEAEIVAEMKSNKSRELARVDSDEGSD